MLGAGEVTEATHCTNDAEWTQNYVSLTSSSGFIKKTLQADWTVVRQGMIFSAQNTLGEEVAMHKKTPNFTCSQKQLLGSLY